MTDIKEETRIITYPIQDAMMSKDYKGPIDIDQLEIIVPRIPVSSDPNFRNLHFYSIDIHSVVLTPNPDEIWMSIEAKIPGPSKIKSY